MAEEVFRLAEPEQERIVGFAGVVWAQSVIQLDADPPAPQRLRQLLDEQPAFGADLVSQLAMVYQTQGDEEASWEVLRLGLERYPLNANLNNALGYSLGNRGLELPTARKMIEIALRESPESAAYLDSMGWVLYKSGEFEAALEWLQKSRAAVEDANPVILDHLGDTYYRLGRPAEALRVWNQAKSTLSAPNYQMFDPEEEGLDLRVQAKIIAVEAEAPAPVAPLGEGVRVPDDAARVTDPAPEPVAAPAPPAPLDAAPPAPGPSPPAADED